MAGSSCGDDEKSEPRLLGWFVSSSLSVGRSTWRSGCAVLCACGVWFWVSLRPWRMMSVPVAAGFTNCKVGTAHLVIRTADLVWLERFALFSCFFLCFLLRVYWFGLLEAC